VIGAIAAVATLILALSAGIGVAVFVAKSSDGTPAATASQDQTNDEGSATSTATDAPAVEPTPTPTASADTESDPAPAVTQEPVEDPAPETYADNEVDLDGTTWSGDMAGSSGKYRFTLSLEEDAYGNLEGQMYQVSSSTGEDGTETLTGSRDGNNISLEGLYWSGAPSGWDTDTIELTVGSDGTMSGQYTCASCSGWHGMSGYQQ
jgi:hypothetical protein